jgi:hypothetical protein
MAAITQTINIPTNRWLMIEVPPEIPAGPAILTFAPASGDGFAPPAVGHRMFGCAKGQFRMADDFDASLEDFKDYM